MSAHKPNEQASLLVGCDHNQPIGVALDIEDHPVVADDIETQSTSVYRGYDWTNSGQLWPYANNSGQQLTTVSALPASCRRSRVKAV